MQGNLLKVSYWFFILFCSVFQIIESFPKSQPVSGKLSCGQVVSPTENDEQDETVNDQQDDIDQDEEAMPPDTTDQTYYCCPEPSCKRTFVRSHNLDRHLAIGNHVYECDKQSGLDIAAKIYSEQSESLKNYQEKLYDASKSETAATSHIMKKGWALKTRRIVPRFSEKVKKYLYSICLSCEQTGTRPDFIALSEEIRKGTNDNNEKLFEKSEWLSPTQIRGCFAQFLSKAKKTGSQERKKQRTDLDLELQEIVPEEDEKLSEVVNMLETNNFNNGVSVVVNNVLSEVNL